MKLSELQQPSVKPKLKMSDVLKGQTESVASEGWEFLENHPVRAALQGLPETLTGKSMEQRANELTQSKGFGQSKDRPYDKNLGIVKPVAEAANIAGQAADIASSPATYIPAGKIIGAVGEKLVPGLVKGLKQSAEGSYGKALGPTTKSEKGIAKDVSPALVDKKEMFMTRQGLLDKAEKNIQKYGADIDKEFDGIPKQTRVNLEPILLKIKKSQDSLKINGEVPGISQARFNQLEKIKLDLINTMKGIKARPEFVRQYRQVLDSAIEETKQGFKMTGRGGAALRAQRTMANSIRGELASKFPNIARLNKEFSLWANLQELLETTAPKTKSPLSSFHAFGAEHATGGAPWIGVFVNLNKLVSDNVLWNSVSGAMKSHLADTLARGDFKRVGYLIDSLRMAGVNSANKAVQPYSGDVTPTLKSPISLDSVLGVTDANAMDSTNDIDMSKDAKIESGGNTNAVSGKGAVGVLQITKPALDDFNKYHKTNFPMSKMKDGNLNKKVGDWYMNVRIPSLLRHYKIQDTKENRLRAYNEGIGNLKKGIYPKETRDYVKRYNAQ